MTIPSYLSPPFPSLTPLTDSLNKPSVTLNTFDLCTIVTFGGPCQNPGFAEGMEEEEEEEEEEEAEAEARSCPL